MPNPLTAAWDFLRANDLKVAPPVERKFTPLDATIDWQRINSLVYGPSRQTETNDGNSAAFACLQVLASSFIEPPLRVWRDTGDGQPDAQSEHPLQALLDDPNPWLTPEELWWWLAWALHVDGNAYLFKSRAGNAERGNVVELWPVSPASMRPKTRRGSTQFIDYYERDTSGRPEEVPVTNIVHFRLGIDDQDMRRGLSPFKRLVRAIATDDEAERYVAAFLGNYGVPGVVVKTPDRQMSLEDAQEIKRKFAAEFQGEGRGKVGVLNNGADVSVVGSNLANLDLAAIRNFPESRIAAVLGVPPELAGLHVGVTEGSASYASSRQIAENFTERKLVPLWRMVAGKVNHRSGLRAEFLGSDPNLVVRYDLSQVRALQEDQDNLYRRIVAAYQGALMGQREARSALGLPPDPEPDDIFLIPASATPTLADEQILELAPAPLPSPAVADGSAGNGTVASASPAKMMQRKRSSVLRRWPELLDAMVELAEPAFERDLKQYFDGARERALAAVTSSNGVVH